MGQPVNRAGDFRANIIEYGLKETKPNESAFINVKMQLLQEWDRHQDDPVWMDCTAECLEAEGFICVIKKNGDLNDFMVEALMNHAGWDGNILSIVGESWEPTPCRVTIKNEVYDNKTRYKIDFINAYDSTPGGRGNVSLDRAKELQTKLAGSLARFGGKSVPSAPLKAAPSQDPNDIPF